MAKLLIPSAGGGKAHPENHTKHFGDFCRIWICFMDKKLGHQTVSGSALFPINYFKASLNDLEHVDPKGLFTVVLMVQTKQCALISDRYCHSDSLLFQNIKTFTNFKVTEISQVWLDCCVSGWISLSVQTIAISRSLLNIYKQLQYISV